MREALERYRRALKISADIYSGKSIDFSVARQSIEVVKKLDPPPAIPEEVRKLAVFAQTATKQAKDEKGYDRAIDEYIKAITLAPWWADMYVNLALLQEQTGRFPEAIESLKLYLLASPSAPDAQTVQTKIYELEFKMKSAKP